MLVNSIKTKNNFHNYIVIKQADNTSSIELLLCGANGSILNDLNQSCTLTILDEVDQLIRQKTKEQIVNGTITFRVANDLKTNPHTLEITTADGQKFPSNHDFKIFVSYTHDESELRVINNLSREEALAEIDQSVKEFISENTEEYIDKVATSKWLYENNFKPKDAVTTFNDLPKDAELKELRGVTDENAVYVYDGTKWIKQSNLNFDGLNDVKKGINEITWNVKSLGVKGDGTTSDTPMIQKILNEYEGRIHFPDGDYIVDKGLLVNKSNVHLTFSPNARFKYISNSTSEPFLKFEGKESKTLYDVAGNITAGQMTINLTSDVVGLSPGDWVKLSSIELYHPARTDYNKQEFLKVAKVSANVITLDSPVFYTYNATSFPVKMVKQELLENVGVSDVQVEYAGTEIARGVEFIRCLNPTIHGSTIKKFERHNIMVDNCVAPRVTENYTESLREDTGLSYGIFVSSCHHTTVTDNRIYSKRTGIDISYMSRKTIVANNIILKGNLNTHGCLDVVITGNTVADGYILLRGTIITVSANSVSSRYFSDTSGMIFMDEVAQLGDIVIVDNILTGHEGTLPANGIYGGGVNGMKNIIIKGNKIKNVRNGISFYRGFDSETPINDVVIAENVITTSGGTGINGVRAEDFIVTGNILTGSDSQTGVGIDFASTTKELKRLIISSNKIRKYSRPIRIWSTYRYVIVTSNISAECSYSIDSQINAVEKQVVNNI